ncbi:hypothetical protein DFP73DRAFT_596176 [Morchella snyderi]|nr:hypothetical protein DFP73DRAFT_596176 [Morchella snyderi]
MPCHNITNTPETSTPTLLTLPPRSSSKPPNPSPSATSPASTSPAAASTPCSRALAAAPLKYQDMTRGTRLHRAALLSTLLAASPKYNIAAVPLPPLWTRALLHTATLICPAECVGVLVAAGGGRTRTWCSRARVRLCAMRVEDLMLYAVWKKAGMAAVLAEGWWGGGDAAVDGGGAWEGGGCEGAAGGGGGRRGVELGGWDDRVGAASSVYTVQWGRPDDGSRD